jgi:hypothetical protein
MSKDKQTPQDTQSKTRVNKPVQEEMKGVETAVVSPIPALQRAYINSRTLSPADAQVLQRTIGNQALGRLAIQRKMTLGPVGDKYEQEADAVAKQVVGKLHATSTQTAPAQTAQRQEEEELQMKPLVQRQEEEEELQMKPLPLVQRQEEEELQMKPLVQRQEEEEELQMKPLPLVQRQEEEELQAKGDSMLAGGELSGDVESSVQSAKSGGQPMSDNIRGSMEQAFNADFSSVKIHADSQADTLNRSLSARAFTTGQDIFFRSGEYNPGSSTGQELIAHELTHTIQQGAAAAPARKQIQPVRYNRDLSKMSNKEAPLQRALMSTKEFKRETGGSSLRHPRKRIAKIDKLLKKIEQSGPDRILLTELLNGIDNWLSVAKDDSSRKAGTQKLRDQVTTDLKQISQDQSKQSSAEPPQSRGRSNAMSAQVTGSGKKYGSDFSDFDSKQFRVSGKAPNRTIEEVKRTKTPEGKIEYYAMGLVTAFNGSVPVIAPYPEPISMGDWYPQVTHINGMAVTPKSGILSAAALQESVNKAIGGDSDVAIGQEAVDILFTYSAQRGNPVVDVWDCIKGKVQVRDTATEKQEEIMLDAVRRKKRVTVSAHSRGTIKTDNAVRNAHKILTAEFTPAVRQESYEEVLAHWEMNDPGIGIDPSLLAEMTINALAKEQAKSEMNAYIQLIYAGNAVQYPSAILKFDMYVGGFDPVSMFVGTYSEVGRKAYSAIGIGSSSDSKLHSVGKTKGHGFVGNYVPAVGSKIAEDLRNR